MRVRFTESVAGVYFDHRPGEEIEVGTAAGQLDPAQADAWLASGTLTRVDTAPETAMVGRRETGMQPAGRRR